MTGRRACIVAGVTALVAIVATSVGPATPRATRPERTTPRRMLEPGRFFDERTFALAKAHASTERDRPSGDVRAVIVPHHWLAGSLIVEGLRDAASSRAVDTVILIGPDHANVGAGQISTSDLPWRTPSGRLEPDVRTIRTLVEGGWAHMEDRVLTGDHSIAGLVPAVRAFFPRARLVPLAIRSGLTADEVAEIADALSIAAPGAIVVGSIDFSHYLSAVEAVRHDRETLDAIRSFDVQRVLGFGNDNVDSPGSLAIVLELMRRVGATKFELRENTNSTSFGGSALQDVTSYIMGYFRLMEEG